MYCLEGTNWDQHKETLLLTYKALGRSIANYAAPVWNTNASDTSLEKIQRTQWDQDATGRGPPQSSLCAISDTLSRTQIMLVTTLPRWIIHRGK